MPAAPYLLLDVDPGADTLNLPPAEVLPRLTAAGRSPLTIAEGVACSSPIPGVLRCRNCFSLLGSRAGDKRVPALWVSARRPRLGWCYQGAPHTWLGSASCAGRLGEPSLHLTRGRPGDGFRALMSQNGRSRGWSPPAADEHTSRGWWTEQRRTVRRPAPAARPGQPVTRAVVSHGHGAAVVAHAGRAARRRPALPGRRPARR